MSIHTLIAEVAKEATKLQQATTDAGTLRDLIALVEPDTKVTIGHDDRAGYAVKVGREVYYGLNLRGTIETAIHFERQKKNAQATN